MSMDIALYEMSSNHIRVVADLLEMNMRVIKPFFGYGNVHTSNNKFNKKLSIGDMGFDLKLCPYVKNSYFSEKGDLLYLFVHVKGNLSLLIESKFSIDENLYRVIIYLVESQDSDRYGKIFENKSVDDYDVGYVIKEFFKDVIKAAYIGFVPFYDDVGFAGWKKLDKSELKFSLKEKTVDFDLGQRPE